MKKLIASRKLKRKCIYCNCNFVKNDIYYKKRNVYLDFGEIYATEFIMCSKCKYKTENQSERKRIFIESGKCTHSLVGEVWRLIPGEDFVQEPSHEECFLCGKQV